VEQLVAQHEPVIRQFQLVRYAGLVGGFAGVCDGVFLPEHPFDAAAPAQSADVPIMIGVTGTEMTLMTIGDARFRTLDDAGLARRLRPVMGDAAAEIVAAYREVYRFYTAGDLFERIRSDYPLGRQSMEIAELKAAQGAAPAFMYRMEWRSPVTSAGVPIRSLHSLEVPLVFANTATSPAVGEGSDARIVAAQMSRAWCAFAHNGDPNTAGLPRWPAYDTKDRATMLFDVDSRVANDPIQVGRLAMERHGASLVREIPLP